MLLRQQETKWPRRLLEELRLEAFESGPSPLLLMMKGAEVLGDEDEAVVCKKVEQSSIFGAIQKVIAEYNTTLKTVKDWVSENYPAEPIGPKKIRKFVERIDEMFMLKSGPNGIAYSAISKFLTDRMEQRRMIMAEKKLVNEKSARIAGKAAISFPKGAGKSATERKPAGNAKRDENGNIILEPLKKVSHYIYALLLANHKKKMDDDELQAEVLDRFPDAKSVAKPGSIGAYRSFLNSGAGPVKPEEPVARYVNRKEVPNNYKAPRANTGGDDKDEAPAPAPKKAVKRAQPTV